VTGYTVGDAVFYAGDVTGAGTIAEFQRGLDERIAGATWRPLRFQTEALASAGTTINGMGKCWFDSFSPDRPEAAAQAKACLSIWQALAVFGSYP